MSFVYYIQGGIPREESLDTSQRSSAKSFELQHPRLSVPAVNYAAATTHFIRDSSSHDSADLPHFSTWLLQQDFFDAADRLSPDTRIRMPEAQEHFLEREAIGCDWFPGWGCECPV